MLRRNSGDAAAVRDGADASYFVGCGAESGVISRMTSAQGGSEQAIRPAQKLLDTSVISAEPRRN